MEVLQELQGKQMGHFSTIIHEFEALARQRGGVSFRHENWRSNGEAHSLARYATMLQPWGLFVAIYPARGFGFSCKHCVE
jgi:hypothetical protein